MHIYRIIFGAQIGTQVHLGIVRHNRDRHPVVDVCRQDGGDKFFGRSFQICQSRPGHRAGHIQDQSDFDVVDLLRRSRGSIRVKFLDPHHWQKVWTRWGHANGLNITAVKTGDCFNTGQLRSQTVFAHAIAHHRFGFQPLVQTCRHQCAAIKGVLQAHPDLFVLHQIDGKTAHHHHQQEQRHGENRN